MAFITSSSPATPAAPGTVTSSSGSSTDNAIARFDGTSGTIIQNSGVIIDDSNNITGVASLTVTTLVATTTITTGDNLIRLNDDIVGTPTENAGIEIERGTSTDAQLIWNETNDRWEAGLTGSTFSINAAGAQGDVQYRDASGNFLADSNLNWDASAKALTILDNTLTTTPSTGLTLKNATAATVNNQKVSPSLLWEGQGFKSGSGTFSQAAAFEAYVLPVQHSSTRPFAQWNLRSVVGGTAINTPISITNGDASELTTATTTIAGKQIISHNQSNGTPNISDHLTLNNTGTASHVKWSFSGTPRYAISGSSSGTAVFRAGGSSPVHEFQVGSSIGSTALILQIYSNGLYNAGNSFNASKVTAGQADTNALSTLNTYGSLSMKGVFVTSNTYTLTSSETMVYTDPSGAASCLGTPTACSTYGTEGACNTHTAIGCSWFSGNTCSEFNGTDSTTCTDGHSGCSWEEVSCQTAGNNTDQSTCEAQDDTYGGNCSWDTGLCPSLGADEATCEAQVGCTWNSSDCHTFDGGSQGTCEGNTGCTWTGGDCHAFDATDQATCETDHTGCTWDAMNNICDGVYNEASTCAGEYDTSCSGNICTGTYNTGNCTGSYGAACQGTANCINLVTSGSCATEAGCSWTVGVAITMPTTATSNTGNTSKFYSVVQLTDGGTTTLLPNTSQTFLQYGSSLKLYKAGDRVTLHHHTATIPCSTYLTEPNCTAKSGCTWNAAIVCSSFNGDESGCTGASNCSWDSGTSICSGSGTAANCSGTYTVFSGWVPHNYERGSNYIAKTANYTLVDVDDVIECTANSFTITFPSAALQVYKRYKVKNSGTGTITLNTTSSQTIDGNASGALTLAAGESIYVESTGSNWIII
jgi:hypothetical protein